ncbi:MAG: hypothetical protein HRU19_26480 [Pseudobacteriovorax sp.]|nr:hypothetical protein [Pseudobacteriovorax sp.]
MLRYLLLILLSPTVIHAKIEDPAKYWGKYDKIRAEISATHQVDKNDREQLGRIIAKLPLGSDERYALESYIFVPDVDNCANFVRSDDYGLLADCIFVGGRDDLSAKKLFDQASSVSEKARVLTKMIAAAARADDLSEVERLSAFIDEIPNDADNSHYILNTAIIMAYLRPTRDLATILKGMEFLKESTAIQIKHGFHPSWEYYNMGVVYLIILYDAKSALPLLQKVKFRELPKLKNDIAIFHSLALLEVGRIEEARQELEKAKYNDFPGREFLRCYHQYIRFRIGDDTRLDECLSISPTTQTDVMLDVAKRLSSLSLADRQMGQFYRQFWAFFQDSMLANIKKRTMKKVNSIEILKREKELEINKLKLEKKDLVIASQEKTKILTVAISILLGLAIFFWFRNQKKQHVIELLREEARANREAEEKDHAYNQFKKIIYPHQINLVKKGAALESTMPTHPGEGIVMCFDIVGSSLLHHSNLKEFFSSVIKDCTSLLTQEYCPEELSATGYRIKELGDGFLCSIGYPFEIPQGMHAEDLSCELAYQFIQKLNDNVSLYDFAFPVHCCIGIAKGSLQGLYPRTGALEYDLFGRGIILANRYESMRKQLFDQINSHIIIMQDGIFENLSAKFQRDFKVYTLNHDLRVRDDQHADRLYYQKLLQTLRKSG